MTWLARTTVMMLLAALVFVIGHDVASAHAQVLGTQPAIDARLDAAPSVAVVDFDTELMDMGAEMVVRRDDGTVVSAVPKVDNQRLSVALDPSAGPGTYRVAFRVVSLDGHSVTSTFAYTVSGPAGAATPSSATEPAPAATPMASVQAAPAPMEPSSSSKPLPFVGLAIVLGGVVLVLLRLRSRPRQADESNVSESPSSGG